jgi:hypothetical protein
MKVKKRDGKRKFKKSGTHAFNNLKKNSIFAIQPLAVTVTPSRTVVVIANRPRSRTVSKVVIHLEWVKLINFFHGLSNLIIPI